ncbi:5-oxoprolinase [Purpureocillium lavendulum]|uniref:5-oxoprolinase n=1 Tax=Purpureocillium lavendulum TaxID=1247861 RepID=A0AB34FMW5_9HYPO|nr:5-oxoprolinase [Purpureocillium lavendulum]
MVGKSTASKRKPGSAGDTRRESPAEAPPAETTAAVAAAVRDARKGQQRLLNIFSDAFAAVLAQDSFSTILQEIKQALYHRDFATAFGSEDYLEAYAARWSPTRALCYAAVFRGIKSHLDGILVDERETAQPHDGTQEEPGREDCTESDASAPSGRLRMLSFGGCAAEHVAFGSYLREAACHGTLTLVDSAPWSHTETLIQQQLTSPPPLSKYASAAARANNKAFLRASQLQFTFSQADALSLDRARLLELVGTQPLVVTLMFTLNELYTDGGIGKTTKFLRLLGEVLPDATLLLVVDSPGSYSEAAVGKEKKKYPMQWLLNHTLLGTETTGYTWEGLESEDSIWFRLPEGLDYPIQLENMRYQMHLYRIHKPKS